MKYKIMYSMMFLFLCEILYLFGVNPNIMIILLGGCACSVFVYIMNKVTYKDIFLFYNSIALILYLLFIELLYLIYNLNTQETIQIYLLNLWGIVMGSLIALKADEYNKGE